MTGLDERKKKILYALIKDYVDTADPVASRTISKKYDLGVSAATIRNEMADLEEMGYIEQPHTSAGRIPSQKGYRYYVDNLIKVENPSRDEVFLLNNTFSQKLVELDSLLQHSCQVLSRLTQYTALIMTPKDNQCRLQKINLIPVSSNQVLVIMVYDNGTVHHRLMYLEDSIGAESLMDFESFLQEKLCGLLMSEINQTMLGEVKKQMVKKQHMIDSAIKMVEKALLDEENSKVYMDGTANMLNQPEFQDVNKIRNVLAALEGDDIKQILKPSASGKNTEVFIGMEMPYEGVNQCSMVTASYNIDGKLKGTVGVLGPTRMAYPRVITIVEAISKMLSQTLSNKKNE